MRTARLFAGVLAGCLLVGGGPARADVWSDMGKQLDGFDRELGSLGGSLEAADIAKKPAGNHAGTLVEAQVAFGTGNFDVAALQLYDYVAQEPKPRDYEVALYYLAESLYQKGDRSAARTYFTELVNVRGDAGRYYQQALERLVELSLTLADDAAGEAAWLAALDAIPADKRRASVPYVRGKYAFAKDDFDAALEFFKAVPKGSDHEYQAIYYTATTHIAKHDLGRASQILAALVEARPKRPADRRVVELAQLALGRLFYERDQPSKAIDSYLEIDRKSDLFDEALYEVAWVYVKSKQFDKALRALELLALADPTSQKLPTVKILEGNLRIRKAQLIKSREVLGVIGQGNPAVEYKKASAVFAETHGIYKEPHDELAKLVDTDAAPEDYLGQITGRDSKTFEVASIMPEVAVAWIREEPHVSRVVLIETDLGEIQDNITDAESTIARLEQSMAPHNQVRLFPNLAKKRTRATEIQEQLFTIQTRLVEEEARAAGGAELPETEARKAAAAELAALPGAELAYEERIRQARANYDKLDQLASEVQVAIESTDATRRALRKYALDADPLLPPLAPLAQAQLDNELPMLDAEIAELRAELDTIRKEIVLGRDEAGVNDELAKKGIELRAQLRAALAAEHAALVAAGGGAGNAVIEQIAGRVGATEGRLDALLASIDTVVDEALVDVRADVANEKAELASYRQEFLSVEAESRALAGTVLGQSFRDVKAKFYDVLVRSDVGTVDVSWSQKEDNDEDLKRFNLSRQRELKQLKDEFRDLLEEDKPIAPTKGAGDAAPAPDPGAPGAAGGDATTPAAPPTNGVP